jgi:hypothetical protein
MIRWGSGLIRWLGGGGRTLLEWLEFTLRAWDRGGRPIRRAEFLERLAIAPGDPAAVQDGPGVPRVRLLAIAVEDFAHIDTSEDAGARSEAFAAAVRDGLIRAAGWLTRQSADVFAELRASGRVTDVFVGGWVTDDQFDLDLPPEFLAACGALGLSVSICTND